LFKISFPVQSARLVAPARIARRFAYVSLLVAGLLFSTRAQGQSTGTVDGLVKDAEGALVPGAAITLINEQDKSHRTTISNAEGYFNITAVPPNTYDLVVTMKGFDAYRVNGIGVHPGDHVNIAKVSLKIGQVSEEITVNANTAGVNLDTPEKSALITADDIQRLSTVGRDATELIRFLPGFAVSTGGNLNNVSTANAAQTMGFGSTSTSSFSANGSTPQTGATSVVSDGASVMDPGDMGASIQNVNMDMVQEINVQTSNFGADEAKGPVVINAVGKSGGSNYHGSAYFFTRNSALNANDWYSNYEQVARPPTYYYYPGANVGGPVKIPGTNFNHDKKMTFFTAFEVYDQALPDGQAGTQNGLIESFVPTNTPCPGLNGNTAPTPGLLGGNLTAPCLAQALNVSPALLAAQCPYDYETNAAGGPSLNNSGGLCYVPGSAGSTYTMQDCAFAGGQVQSSPNNAANCVPGAFLPVDPHTLIYSKFYPTPNRTPRAVPGANLASDGYNYQAYAIGTHNGYQYRARVDQSFSDSLKLFVTYNLEKINDEARIDNVYYGGYAAAIIPYPTPAFSNAKSNGVSVNLTKVLGPTLTNELIVAGTYFYSPSQLQNPSLVSDSKTGWTGGRYYDNGADQLPAIRDTYQEGTPNFAMGYFPPGSAFLRKDSYNVSDNVTKQLRTHSIKVGFYGESTANNQVPYNYTQGQYSYTQYQYPCVTDDGKQQSQLENDLANFLQGCGSFLQYSSSLNADLHFHTVDFYATDEWKATKRLTLTLGLRFDHLGAWYDPNGLGMAVWTPPAQHVLYAATSGDAHTYPGISWHQTNHSDPISGQGSRPLFYSPRVGLAYDLYGDGKTTLRGGWGAYRFHDSYNDSAGPLNTVIGIQEYQSPSNLSCDYSQIAAEGVADASGHANSLAPGVGCPAASGAASGAGVLGQVYAFDKNDTEQPVTYNYTFTVDQQIFKNNNLEISYVGNQSHNIFTNGNSGSNISDANQNYIPLGGLFQPDPLNGTVTQPGTQQQQVADYRPYPNYTQIFVPHHIAYGNYNALQVSFNKQKGAFIYGANYTWAKALGIRGDYRTGTIGDPSVLRNNYGYLGFNRNNAVNGTYSWQVGNLYHGNHFVGALVNQWEFSGITSLQSGPDVAILDGSTNFGLGGSVSYTPPGSQTAISLPLSNSAYLGTPDINLQPVVTCAPNKNLHYSSSYGKQYINGACLALPKLGTNGNFELPDIHGPYYFDTDLTVKRSFKVREKQNIQFSLAGFNFLNHPLRSFSAGGNNTGLGLAYGLPSSATPATYNTAAAALAAATSTNANFGYTPYKQGYRIVELGARYNF
jgi:hypothetical protein